MKYFVIYYTASITYKGNVEKDEGIIGIISDSDARLQEKIVSHLSSIYRREYEGCDDVQIHCDRIENVPETRYKELSVTFKA